MFLLGNQTSLKCYISRCYINKMRRKRTCSLCSWCLHCPCSDILYAWQLCKPSSAAICLVRSLIEHMHVSKGKQHFKSL